MTISRRKMFGLFAAAPVAAAGLAVVVQAEPEFLSPSPNMVKGPPLFVEGDKLYNGVIIRRVDAIGYSNWTVEETAVLRRARPIVLNNRIA